MGAIQLRDFKRNYEKTLKKFKKQNVIQIRDLNMLEDDTWDWFVRMGFIDSNVMPILDYKHINGALANKPIAVIGSGYSGREIEWKNLKNIYTIGINHIIELYHDLDYLIFQDHRFLRKNKYPLGQFKGLIFVATSNPAAKRYGIKNIRPFIPISMNAEVSERIEKGLYARKSTGLCALNLALILGGNPIYMIGLDNHKDWEKQFPNYKGGIHIHPNYSGSVNTKKAADGYVPVLQYFKKFIRYKKRIVNVCENGIMDWFKQISVDQFNKIISKNIKNNVKTDDEKRQENKEQRTVAINR